jgi:hypothetical protein
VKGLIVDEPWISKILRGEKHWEMRTQATSIRERVALIRKGSGLVVGVVRITGCTGALTLDQLRAHSNKHGVPMEEFESGRAAKWTTAWELSDAQALRNAVPYKHPLGAVIWVSLDAGVQASVQAQIEDEPIEILSSVSQFAGPLPVRGQNIAVFQLDPSTLVPVAKDGTWFGPHLLRAGQFMVGEKGDERRLDSFDEALQALRSMAVPRWRRPNAKCNWGIVSGSRWARAGDLTQAPDL